MELESLKARVAFTPKDSTGWSTGRAEGGPLRASWQAEDYGQAPALCDLDQLANVNRRQRHREQATPKSPLRALAF